MAASKFGKINTLHLPEIFDLFTFILETKGSKALSNCNSPSTLMSGLSDPTSSLALITLFAKGCLALPKVENESNPTQGLSLTNSENQSLLTMAELASSSTDGLITTPQSAKMNVSFLL